MSAQAPQLYRRVLSSARQAFAGDAATNSAWRAHMRQRFEAARAEPDAAVQQQAMQEANEIVEVLRRNVVQGRWNEETEAYSELPARARSRAAPGSAAEVQCVEMSARTQRQQRTDRCGGTATTLCAAAEAQQRAHR
jgi:hypothetical protein